MAGGKRGDWLQRGDGGGLTPQRLLYKTANGYIYIYLHPLSLRFKFKRPKPSETANQRSVVNSSDGAVGGGPCNTALSEYPDSRRNKRAML
jgi:hypothetical protein